MHHEATSIKLSEQYAEPENFGTLMLGLFNAGQGRAEEILLRK